MLKEMKLEFNEIVGEVISYLSQAWIAVNPILKWLCSILAYILFPTETYMTYAMIVGFMVLLDLVSKYYAISVTNGGFWNALRNGHLSSNKMWIGTRKKIVSYFVVMLLVGLTYRFEMLQTPAEFLATLAYSVMFFREGQSVLENMMQAGHKDLSWLHGILKRKERQLIESGKEVELEIKEKKDSITVELKGEEKTKE